VSAVTDHEEAQRATMAARDALGALNTLIAAGDRGVSGSDLQAAEAEVTVAERLEAGALARAQAEQADAEAAAKAAAIDALMDGYRSTSADLSSAIERALASLTDLLTAAATHQTTTRNGFSATRLDPKGGVPGHGHLLTPTPEKVIEAVIELAYKQIGMSPTTSFPHLTIEPIAPFLPVGVAVR
jgi:hypothetical protein